MNWWWVLVDWEIYRAAASAWVAGANPYLVGDGEGRFFYPVWWLSPVVALNSLPYPTLFYAVTILLMASPLVLARKLSLTPLQTAAVVTSAFNLWGVGYGNIAALCLLGLVFPTPIALFFLIMKPQGTAAIILVLLLREFDEGGWRRLLAAVAPVSIALAISVAVYGIPAPPAMGNGGNFGFFPYSLLIGLPALAVALYKRSMKAAFVASPFLFPYVGFSGYASLSLAFPLLSWIVSYVAIFFRLTGVGAL